MLEGDAWREKILADLGRIEPMMDATWSHKATKDNFQRWLAAPESAAPFELNKIFKSLGYSFELTQRTLSPAVPFILMSADHGGGD